MCPTTRRWSKYTLSFNSVWQRRHPEETEEENDDGAGVTFSLEESLGRRRDMYTCIRVWGCDSARRTRGPPPCQKDIIIYCIEGVDEKHKKLKNYKNAHIAAFIVLCTIFSP